MRLTYLVSLSFFLVAGCPETSAAGADGGPIADGGPVADAGSTVDAGTVDAGSNDAGTPDLGGPQPVDSGTGLDAGPVGCGAVGTSCGTTTCAAGMICEDATRTCLPMGTVGCGGIVPNPCTGGLTCLHPSGASAGQCLDDADWRCVCNGVNAGDWSCPID